MPNLKLWESWLLNPPSTNRFHEASKARRATSLEFGLSWLTQFEAGVEVLAAWRRFRVRQAIVVTLVSGELYRDEVAVGDQRFPPQVVDEVRRILLFRSARECQAADSSILLVDAV